ncbi:CBS domain-containing protein [Candidatus Woesearchaeota archaeon]|nr:CBS domain-containing protein [Candidatus Woesearchaeota archaeon]
MDNKVTDIMTRRVVTIEKGKGLRHIVKVIAESNAGSVVITENGKPIGIITEKDLIKKILLKSKEISKTSLDKVMTTGLITGSRTATANDATHIMKERNITHLPIMDQDRIIGIVTEKDIANRANFLFKKNLRFMRYQNIQTLIIMLFFVFLIAILIYKRYTG